MEQKRFKSSIYSTSASAVKRLEQLMVFTKNENNILLIEDNIGDARLVEVLLKQSDLINCTVTHVSTLGEGLELLENNFEYAVVLLDLSLPDSQGIETLEALIGRFPLHNVIVLTGFSDKNLGIQAVKSGAQDFLVKGDFDADTLAKTLRFSIERKNVIKRLEETQRIAHIGSWEYHPLSQKFIASDETYRIFGFHNNPKFQDAHFLEDINHPMYVFREIHELCALAQPNALHKDMKIFGSDGEARIVYIQCSVQKKGNDKILFQGIIQDISERKLAEERMAQSQARYENIFSKSKDAIFIATFDGKITDFNKATSDLTAIPMARIKGANISTLFGNLNFWNEVIEDVEKGMNIKDRAFDFYDYKDKQTYCLLTASPLELEDFRGFNCILRDITERKHAEELRKARDLAKQSAQLKEKFIASISHEMRTPMNAILGMSNLVLKTKGLSEEQLNYIQSIKHSSEILLGIVNDILEIATLQNGKIKFEYKVFDLHELLANLVNVMVYKINEKDLSFELSIADDVPQYLTGDKIRLNQILYNLVGNAIKFTDEGSIRIGVSLLNESSNSLHIKFMVSDTGIGIPSDKIGAIFDTFTRIRTKERIFEGTGLGLSIAKDLVEYQGGKIWVESKLGIGSTFYFDLILERADVHQDSEHLSHDTTEPILINADYPFKLLLVEDHKMNQLVAKKTLERQWKNIDISIADNGQIAIDLLNKHAFDIVLMDLQMPIMDGYEATNFIRTQMSPEKAKTPILAMTAHAHISKDEKFKEYGMDDFVLKPFEPEQLFQKISKYVTLSLS